MQLSSLVAAIATAAGLAAVATATANAPLASKQLEARDGSGHVDCGDGSNENYKNFIDCYNGGAHNCGNDGDRRSCYLGLRDSCSKSIHLSSYTYSPDSAEDGESI